MGLPTTHEETPINGGLSELLEPRSIAIVGASAAPDKIGGKVLNFLCSHGYTGRLYLVNSRHATIAGKECHASVADLPEPVDLVVVCVPALEVLQVLEACSVRKVSFAVVLSSGFAEAGRDGAARQLDLANAASRGGVRLLGPNCLGVFSAWNNSVVSFSSAFSAGSILPGPVGIVAQSGALAASILTYVREAELGVGNWITTGNEADITWLEVAEALVQDDRTRIIVVYAETLRDGERLLRLGRSAANRGKHIVLMRAGRSAASQEAILSHTGSLASSNLMAEGVLRQARVVELNEPRHLPQIATLLLQGRSWNEGGIGVLTTSGGAGILFVDACASRALPIASLSAPTIEELRASLPDFASTKNPVDITASLIYRRGAMRRPLEAMIKAKEVGAIALILTLVTGSDAEAAANEIATLASQCTKPFIVIWLAGELAASAYSILRVAGVPVFADMTEAATALAQYRRTVGFNPPGIPYQPQSIELEPGVDILTESDAKQLLERYDVLVPEGRRVESSEEARRAAEELGGPLAVKSESRKVLHRAAHAALRLNVEGGAAIEAAWSEIRSVALVAGDSAGCNRVRIERMSSVSGFELLVGARRDSVLGSCIVVGQGGGNVEVADDVTSRLAPLAVDDAKEMLAELRAWPTILKSLRSQDSLERLARTLVSISYLIKDLGDRLSEMDVNPLLVQDDGSAIALDALIVLRSTTVGNDK